MSRSDGSGAGSEPALGSPLHVFDEGHGTPLLFIHGLMMSGELFRHQKRSLPSPSTRVVIPDLRGHGSSPKPLTGHTVPTYAHDVLALLHERDIQRPLVIGWSMGAMVACELVHIAGPSAVAGLIIVDQPPTDFCWPDYPHGLLDCHGLAEMVEAIQTDMPGFAAEFARKLISVEDPTTIDWITREICTVPPAIASTIAVDQTLRDYRGLLREIRVPICLVFGADDKLVDPRAGIDLAQQLPGSRFELFDHSSHCPFLEEPERFNTLVQELASTV